MSIELINLTDFPVFGFEHKLLVGNPYYIVIAKQSFCLTPEGKVVQLAQQKDIRFEDVIKGNPHRNSVVEPSDLIPYKDHAEIILVGSAHQKKPQTGWRTEISIQGLRDDHLETEKVYADWAKSVWVTGGRQWQRVDENDWKLSDIKPTTQVSLAYEYAYGGSYVLPENPNLNKDEEPENIPPPIIKYAKNPSGTSWIPTVDDITEFTKDDDADHVKLQQESMVEQLSKLTSMAAPQLFASEEDVAILRNADEPTEAIAVAGYGSFPNYWHERMHKLEGLDWESADGGYPENFDVTHWQQAPADQWLPVKVLGGEKLILTGIFPEGKQEYELPNNRLRLRIIEPSLDLPIYIGMDVDTIYIDTDNRTVELVWRFNIFLPDLDENIAVQVDEYY